MKILITGHYKNFFLNEKCFSSKNGSLHENNFVKFITLKGEFYKHGINLVAGDDINEFKDIDALIVHDHPNDPIQLKSIQEFSGPKYLTTEEAPFILPNSFKLERLDDYRLIFSNFPPIISHSRIIPSLPHHIDRLIVNKVREFDIPIEMKSKKVFVGTNKKPHEKNAQNSNYKLRDELLMWYRVNDPNSFDLYGSNWSRKFLNGNNLPSKIFNYYKFDKILNGTDKRYSDFYKGKIKSKYFNLSKYKFQFCLESVLGFEGYVTEKIFDGLICRNIPVYNPSTPTSLKSILPDNIYINMTDFKSIKDLNDYLNAMQCNEFIDYISRIDNFIDNLPAHLHENYWACNVVKNITSDLNEYKLFNYL
jgi:hypothetical protein